MTQTALTLSEAAEACDVSRSTIKRKLPGFENAYQDGAKVWKVPISDLLASGLTLRRPTVTEVDDPPVNGADQGQESAGNSALLIAELAAERERRLVAETKVMLLTANLEDLRFSLRAISGPPAAPVASATPGPRRAAAEPAEPSPAAVRRGFRAWLRGG